MWVSAECPPAKRTVMCIPGMVVDAVSSEPVSGLEFPGNREIYREFRASEPSCADQTARKCLPIGPFSAFGSCPVQNRAGNFRTGIRELSGGDQGTCYREQGSRSVGSDDALLEKRLEPRNDLKNRVALVDQLPGAAAGPCSARCNAFGSNLRVVLGR
jgi:hypothetical protein